MSRHLYKIAGTIYGYLFFRKRLTFEEALVKLDTPFKIHAYQCKWFRYRANEDVQYNKLQAEEVWSDEMLDENGKHWDDCDGYAVVAARILNGINNEDPCRLVSMFTDDSGHATCLVQELMDTKTIGTFGLWSHGLADSLPDICQKFYKEPIKRIRIYDDRWNLISYGEEVNGKWEFVEV